MFTPRAFEVVERVGRLSSAEHVLAIDPFLEAARPIVELHSEQEIDGERPCCDLDHGAGDGSHDRADLFLSTRARAAGLALAADAVADVSRGSIRIDQNRTPPHLEL